MVTVADIRAVALTLPRTTEHGRPNFPHNGSAAWRIA